MGPVHSESAQAEEAAAESETKAEGAPKRLYRIKEDSKVWGVCTGLAAYFNVDVTIVRLAFVLLTLISHGFGASVYIVLALVIPLATTNAEKASARGAHFNAHEFIESLRKMYAEHRPHGHTERAHHRHNENWRRVGRSLSSLAHLIAGTVAIVCSIALGILTIGAIATLWSLLSTGLFFGYPLLFGASSILLVIFVAALYYIPAWILILIIRESRRIINPREEGPRDIWSITAGAVSWGIAIAIVITIFALSFPRFDHTQTPYGFQFNVKHRHVCVGGNNYCAVPVVSEVPVIDVVQ
jgi:phage shock protein PspC (stress-responsive transcriptional regulator)